MGWQFRRRVRVGRNSWLNLSKRGASASTRVGPFTFNSRGRGSVRVGRGLSYRSGCAIPIALMAAASVALATAATRVVRARGSLRRCRFMPLPPLSA